MATIKKLNLLRSASTLETATQSHRVTLEVVSAEGIVKEVFVKQRLRKNDYSGAIPRPGYEDTFAAVCTPVQLEDLPAKAPDLTQTSFYRDSQVDLIGDSPEYVERLVDDIVKELKMLVTDVEVLDRLQATALYSITPEGVTVNMAEVHYHYRLPLVARPAGTIETYVNADEEECFRITTANTDLSGWLPTNPSDPAGYHFKYNIARDTQLSELYPPDADKLSLSVVEQNGIVLVEQEVLLTPNGIYWKQEELHSCPWPADYIDKDTPVAYQKVLILSLVK